MQIGKTLRRPRIAVLGGAVADLVFVVNQLPDWKQSTQAHSFYMFPGGKGLNQAIAASRLGASVSLIGAVGHDYFGQAVLQALDHHGVSREFVEVVPGATPVTNVFVNEQGDASFIGWKSVANTRVDAALVGRAEGILRRADAILVSLEVSLEAVEQAISIARRHAKFICLNPAPPVDPPSRFPATLLQDVDLLVPSAWEAARLLGVQRVHSRVGARKLHSLGVKIVCVITPQLGCVVAADGQTTEVPSHVVGKPVDITGASDAFCASMAVALARHKPLRVAVSWAAAAAAVAVGRLGGSPSMPYPHQITEILRAAAKHRPAGRTTNVSRWQSESALLEICRRREDQKHEFKRAGTDTRKITKEIAGFLHTRVGGVILYGVEDDGSISGTDVSRQQLDQQIQNSLYNSVIPVPKVQVLSCVVKGKEVIVIAIPAWDRDHVHWFDGKVWIRRGTNVFEARPEEIGRLHKGQFIN